MIFTQENCQSSSNNASSITHIFYKKSTCLEVMNIRYLGQKHESGDDTVTRTLHLVIKTCKSLVLRLHG